MGPLGGVFNIRSYFLQGLCYFYLGPPRPAGENNSLICVSLIKNPGGSIANHHALELVSKSQPLKVNSERALTPAVHRQIRLAVTVYFVSSWYFHSSTGCSVLSLASTSTWPLGSIYLFCGQNWQFTLSIQAFIHTFMHAFTRAFVYSFTYTFVAE